MQHHAAEIWLLRLTQIADSAFPTGAFGHSMGLEYAIQNRWITTRQELESWTQIALVHSLIPLDGRACLKAWRLTSLGAEEQWIDLDNELASFRPSLAQRLASAQMGRALWENASNCFELGSAGVEAEKEHSLQFPTVWGRLCCLLDIPIGPTVLTYIQGVIRSWAQVALRIIPLGQSQSFSYLSVLTEELVAREWDWEREAALPLQSLCPGWDIAQIGQESLAKRYFRS